MFFFFRLPVAPIYKKPSAHDSDVLPAQTDTKSTPTNVTPKPLKKTAKIAELASVSPMSDASKPEPSQPPSTTSLIASIAEESIRPFKSGGIMY